MATSLSSECVWIMVRRIQMLRDPTPMELFLAGVLAKEPGISRLEVSLI